MKLSEAKPIIESLMGETIDSGTDELTMSGLKSELSHFETYGITTASEWRSVYAIVEAMDYVESIWFVATRQPQEVALYDRTVALVEKYLPKLEGKS